MDEIPLRNAGHMIGCNEEPHGGLPRDWTGHSPDLPGTSVLNLRPEFRRFVPVDLDSRVAEPRPKRSLDSVLLTDARHCSGPTFASCSYS